MVLVYSELIINNIQLYSFTIFVFITIFTHTEAYRLEYRYVFFSVKKMIVKTGIVGSYHNI